MSEMIMKFRCSSLASIMGDPKSGDGLSQAAKTYLNGLAKEFSYSYIELISGKEFEKGIACEDALIELYNDVFFTQHEKNKERKSNLYITGEPDIVVPHVKIIDVKNAFSLATFPDTEEEVKTIAKKSGYDWQGKGYLWLFDSPLFELVYGVVSTPEELMKPWYQVDLHQVDHIDPMRRITRTFIERDKADEEKIVHKSKLANEYLLNRIAQINLDHKF